MVRDVVVIGAGISGLALARQLRAAGLAPVVLERARGLGGRCATRRVDGQPVDHGVAFLHGRDPRFLAELDRLEGVTRRPGWPVLVQGQGVPCQPEAFDPSEQRVAFGEGVSRFAKHLAQGTEVWLNTRVTSLRPAARGTGGATAALEVGLETGETLAARAVALALPVPQAERLLGPLAVQSPAVAAVRPLLGLVQMAACATVIARYPAGAPRPAWDAWYPETAGAVQSIFHDSAKRAEDAALTLVVQGRPGWSRSVAEQPPERWAEALLGEAADSAGAWAARPADFQTHFWRYARVHRTSELVAPVLLDLENGAALGCCGDGFHVAAGLEGAYLSGVALGHKLAGRLASGEVSRSDP
jgi:renalase